MAPEFRISIARSPPGPKTLFSTIEIRSPPRWRQVFDSVANEHSIIRPTPGTAQSAIESESERNLSFKAFSPDPGSCGVFYHLAVAHSCYRQSGGVILVRLWPGFVFAATIMAQELAPIGIVRGALIECDATHLTLGVEESRIFRFLTDGRTFIERDHMRIFCPSLRKGERIELVSDRSPEAGTRYARLVSVVNVEVRPRRQQALM